METNTLLGAGAVARAAVARTIACRATIGRATARVAPTRKRRYPISYRVLVGATLAVALPMVALHAVPLLHQERHI